MNLDVGNLEIVEKSEQFYLSTLRNFKRWGINCYSVIKQRLTHKIKIQFCRENVT